MVRTTAVLQLVVDALMASAAVQGLVQNRVHGGWGRSSDLGTIPKPALVLVPDGGTGAYSGTVAEVNVTLYAVSALGTAEALDVYETARDLLQASELCHAVNDHRGLAVELERPRTGWVDEAACWYAVGTWRVIAARMTP